MCREPRSDNSLIVDMNRGVGMCGERERKNFLRTFCLGGGVMGLQGRQGKARGMMKLEYLLGELVGKEVKGMWEF